MSEYLDEQITEIEALEAIYPQEFTLISDKPHHKFTILIKSTNYNEDQDEEDLSIGDNKCGEACLTLQFQYTPKYPDEALIMELIEPDNIDEEEDFPKLEEHLKEQIEESLGMVMVFTVVSAATEWLNSFVDERQKFAEEEFERKKEEQEEKERKVFEGTRVSVETFMTWKAKFDAEMSLLKKEKEKEEEGLKKKLSGRELFMADKTLNESDLSFLGEGEGNVAVDESLFESLDDLDLDDDLDSEEDPDYVP